MRSRTPFILAAAAMAMGAAAMPRASDEIVITSHDIVSRNRRKAEAEARVAAEARERKAVPAPRIVTAADEERMRQARERRARKAARQARGIA